MCQIEPFKEQVNINIVKPDKPGPNSTGLTILDAVFDTYPKAKTCNDLLNTYLGQNHVLETGDSDKDSDSDQDLDEEDEKDANPKTPTKRKKIKPTKHTARRSALLGFAFTAVLE